MKKYNVLILTDHSHHSSENSLYKLANAMSQHHYTGHIYIASRGNKANHLFFESKPVKTLEATSIKNGIQYDNINPLGQNLESISIDQFDLIWLRLPPPLGKFFLNFLDKTFAKAVVINNPKSIYKTGSKEYLLNFQEVCAPMQICNSVEDIAFFKSHFPIILKPLRDYGGNGIVKIDGDKVSTGKQTMTYDTFIKNLPDNKNLNYLGVRFLKNVYQGDKRIVVVNGEVLGASLRLPADGSWLCNVAMGGSSHLATLEPEEYGIVNTINPHLLEKGIVMYGVDTLVGDNGKRVLSEINTTSIGGLPQIAALMNKPLVEKAIDLIWDYYLTKINKINEQ